MNMCCVIYVVFILCLTLINYPFCKYFLDNLLFIYINVYVYGLYPAKKTKFNISIDIPTIIYTHCRSYNVLLISAANDMTYRSILAFLFIE